MAKRKSNKTTLTINLDPEVDEYLKAIAQLAEESKSAVIRVLLAKAAVDDKQQRATEQFFKGETFKRGALRTKSLGRSALTGSKVMKPAGKADNVTLRQVRKAVRKRS